MLVSLRSVSVGSEGDGLCTSTLRELRILSQLRHTHIIRLLEIVRDRTSQDATYTSPSGTAVRDGTSQDTTYTSPSGTTVRDRTSQDATYTSPSGTTVRDRTSQDATYTSPSGTTVLLLEHCGEWSLLIVYRTNLCWNCIYCHKSYGVEVTV